MAKTPMVARYSQMYGMAGASIISLKKNWLRKIATQNVRMSIGKIGFFEMNL